MEKRYINPYDMNEVTPCDENGIAYEHCHSCCLVLDFNVRNVDNRPVFCEDCMKEMEEI